MVRIHCDRCKKQIVRQDTVIITTSDSDLTYDICDDCICVLRKVICNEFGVIPLELNDLKCGDDQK